ncbi:MAG: YtxH domain-containing protein [Bacteroidetes bacterium]|nr:YtxH domain-containing protein [Bacteroidota bacterium]
MGENGKLVIALLAGVAAGIAIGILIAPQKGSESRQKLTDAAKDLADSIIQKAEEALDGLKDEKSKTEA